MVGLEGLLYLLLQKKDGLANIGGILVSIYETVKTRRICLRLLFAAKQQNHLRVFLTGNLVFTSMNLKPAVFKKSVSAREMFFRHSYQSSAPLVSKEPSSLICFIKKVIFSARKTSTAIDTLLVIIKSEKNS